MTTTTRQLTGALLVGALLVAAPAQARIDPLGETAEETSIATVWQCNNDDDVMTADGSCWSLPALVDQFNLWNQPTHPADSCREDEAWAAIDYRDPRGTEDIHGVSRACVNVSEVGK